MKTMRKTLCLLVVFAVVVMPTGVHAAKNDTPISENEFTKKLLVQNEINVVDSIVETIETDLGKVIMLTNYTSTGGVTKELVIPYIETKTGVENSFAALRQWNPELPGTYSYQNSAILSDFTVNVKVFFEKTTHANHFRLYWTDAKWTKTNSNSTAYVSKLHIGTTVIADKYSYPGLTLLQRNASAETTKIQNNPTSGNTYGTNILMPSNSNYVYKLANFMEHTSHGWVEFTYYDSKGRQRVDAVHIDAMRY